MTSIIKYSLKELEEMVKDDKTCVSKRTVSQNIAFQPWCLANLKESLEKIMNNKIGKYDKNLNGIILSYKNVKILDDVYAIHKDSSELFSDVEADFYIFQPHVGATLCGVVNKKSKTHLGVLVHKVFNVVIPTPSNQTSKTWIGSKLNVGQQVEFKIIVLDLFGALPYIRGTLDESLLPPEADEVDTTLDAEVEELSSMHVNFDGTKPKFIKKVIKAEESPKKNGDDKKPKHKSETIQETKPKAKSKHKECIPSDSDFVSDVDDAVLKEQEEMMKKVMLADKKKHKVKKTQTLTASTPGLKKLHNEINRGMKQNNTPTSYKKEIKDTILIRNRKISLTDSIRSSAAIDNSVINSLKASISNSSPNNSFSTTVNNSISPPVSTKKNSKKKSIASENSCSEIVPKKEAKRRSLDLNILENGSKNNDTSLINGRSETEISNLSDSISSKVSETRDDERKRYKLEKKRLKQEMKNLSHKVQCTPELSHVSRKKSTDVKITSPLVADVSSPSIMISLSPKKKRKRKYSESFQNEAIKSTDDICSSSDAPTVKKRKKDKSYLEGNNQTSSSMDLTLSPTSSLINNCDTASTKVKKKRKKDKEESDDSNYKTSKQLKDASSCSSKDETADDRMKKVQELLVELASDPTLLTDIQTLIKSRRSK